MFTRPVREPGFAERVDDAELAGGSGGDGEYAGGGGGGVHAREPVDGVVVGRGGSVDEAADWGVSFADV